jgi:DOMON domain
MWAIDRSNLIILGIVLGIVALVGLTLLFAPVDPMEPVAPSNPNQRIAASPTPSPVAPEPVIVTIQPQPAPTPEPATLPTPPVETVPSTPIVDGIIHTGEYPHAIEAGGFRVYWTNDANVLRIGLFSPGTGYVAIGLDPDRRMQGANFIIGTVRNGRADIRDDYGIASLTHGSDIDNGGTNDILAFAGRELSGQTTLEFIIPLDSGDRFDKPLEPGGTYDVLVAFHNTNDSFSARHSQRGSGVIRLDDVAP